MLYRYLKASPEPPVLKNKKGKLTFLSVLFLVVGVIFLANATLPILLYQLKSRVNFNPKMMAPISAQAQVLGEGVATDYRRPSSWFPLAPELPPRSSKITHYTLSIPKLKIEEAVVEIGGENIMESLVQYSGTALPGQYGNPVIFGHSSLPQFFNVENYKTIFATLPTLEEGDEVLIDFDGVQYRYQVIKMIEVDPTDISVLAQYYDSQYLTLVTCVPPGTYLRRLVIRAKLI